MSADTQPQENLIFLSHASEDKPAVIQFAELLVSRPLAKEHSIDIWLDKTNVTSMDNYTTQFARALHDRAKICAFVLFMPKDNPKKELKPWVQHEVEQALERRMRDKADDRSFPMAYVYPGKRSQRLQPQPEIANWVSYESVYDNDEIADAFLKDVVASIQANQALTPVTTTNQEVTAASPPETPEVTETAPAQPASPPLLTCTLRIDNGHISAEHPSKHYTSCDLAALQYPGPRTQPALQHLFPDLAKHKHACIRITTDDPTIALLPWLDLLPDHAVCVSPARHNHTETLAIRKPLIVIPKTAQHALTAGEHFTLLQSYVSEYLGIRGLTRVTTVDTLKHQLRFQPPDLIYIYAGFDQQRVILDKDNDTTPHDFTLDTLGEWLATTGQKPIVIANLAGEHLTEYPATLVQHTRMAWIQSCEDERQFSTMTDHFLGKIAALPQQSSLLPLIGQQKAPYGIIRHLWIKEALPELSTQPGDSFAAELRVELLRLMLGRKTLKDSLYGHITSNPHAMMTYVVTGDSTACPADFPEQLQQRLEDWNKQGRPVNNVVPYYFSLNIDKPQVEQRLLSRAQDEGLMRYARNAADAFNRELERRGWLETHKYIALNWHITLTTHLEEEDLQYWLQTWADFVHREFIDYIPHKAALLLGMCLEVPHADEAQRVQDIANDALDEHLYKKNIDFYATEQALGKLPVREIRDFLSHPYWHKKLKLNKYAIDPHDYARWVHQRTNKGEFEATVQTLWTQFTTAYQDYRTP